MKANRTLIIDNGRLAHDVIGFFIIRDNIERLYVNNNPSRRRRIENLVSGKKANLYITGNSICIFYNF